MNIKRTINEEDLKIVKNLLQTQGIYGFFKSENPFNDDEDNEIFNVIKEIVIKAAWEVATITLSNEDYDAFVDFIIDYIVDKEIDDE